MICVRIILIFHMYIISYGIIKKEYLQNGKSKTDQLINESLERELGSAFRKSKKISANDIQINITRAFYYNCGSYTYC